MTADLKLVAVIDNDQAEWKIIGMANDAGIFAMQMGYVFEPPLNEAFGRLLESDMFRLLDLQAVTAGVIPVPVMCRIFKLTAEGEKRRAVLRARFA